MGLLGPEPEAFLGRSRAAPGSRKAALATAVLAMPDTMLAAQRLASQSRQSRQRLDVAGSLATFDESTTENCCACGELRITGEVSLCGDIECVVDIDWLRERDCARHRVTRFVHQRLPSLRQCHTQRMMMLSDSVYCDLNVTVMSFVCDCA